MHVLCICNWVGLDKFFDLDLIGVGFRWNGLWWCCPNFYSFIFLATKQRLKKNWEMNLLEFEDRNFRIYDFFFFFMLNFLGLWIWFLGLWILFAGGFVVDWKMRKSGFELWFNLYMWVLWFEKIWEDLLLGLCLCSCWRLICVCVWLTRKGKKMQENLGKKMQENLGMCSYV